ncbi:MAG: ABC transporter substrate-binding protein [Alphaproteobacteria bacterium]|nr:ABC transporter substrate-binding protein [Alphaproteobacteria bacterium]
MALAAGGGAAFAQVKPIKVGQFFDLTGGGATAAESAMLGTEVALKEIAAAGGIAGRPVQTVVADTQTDATVGVGEMKRLVLQEKVDIIFGPIISQVLLASAPVLNEGKITSIGGTGSEAITPQAANFYFSVLINADSQAKAMVNQAADVLKAKSVAILSDSGAQAKSFVESIKAELTARNIKLTGTQEYQYRATDMTPQLLALKRGNPDTLLLFSSSGEDVGNSLKSLQELGWNVPVTGNYTVGAFAETAIKVAGKEAFKNVTGTNYRAFTHCAGAPAPVPFSQFVAKAKALKADAATRLSLPFAALFYDAVYLVKAAIEGTGGKTDGPSLTAWIEENAKNHKGILDNLTPSKTSHFLVGVNALTTVRPDRVQEGGVQERMTCS